MKSWFLLLLGGLLLSAGCTSTSMKGTPFYSGEYGMREGPAAERVNLWPLVYYREPALSVLWPFMEFSPEHQAVRPIYSSYDRDTDHPVYNVLWPIGHFDPANQDYRFFPVFWGDEYFDVFPLYWHNGDPFSGVGYNSLFPVWIWNRRGNGYYLSIVWPLYANYQYPNREGSRFWPLYGARRQDDSVYRYFAWPFIHSYTNSMGSGNVVLPLWYRGKTDNRSFFVSLPYSRSMTSDAGVKSWDLALPLCYRSWTGDSFKWLAIPALSWGRRDDDISDNWFVLGLGRYGRAPGSLDHHVIPLYYYARNPESRSIYTLPWWSKENADGSGWNALLPFYYHGYSDEDSSFYSLPWFSKKWWDGSGWHTSIPLYYRSYSKDASAFYSLPWLSERHTDGSHWQASFPFYYGSGSTNGTVLVTPLYARKLQPDGSAAWRVFVPFVYFNEKYDSHFMTILGGRWRMGDHYNWLALPLLSGGGGDATSGRNIWLAGLAGQKWTSEGGSHYVFPLYYAAPFNGTFVSLPYITWIDFDRRYHILPLLLSGWYADDEGSRSILAAGLAGHRSGMDPYSYVLPIYYAAPEKGKVLSLPYCAWSNGDRQSHFIPPLLSYWYTDNESKGAYLIAGLTGFREGGDHPFHYVFPFYYTAPEDGEFLSLPYASWSTGDKQCHALPLLLSGWNTSADSTEYLLLGGLGYWRHGNDGEVQGSHILPLYMWDRDNYFYTILYGKNKKLSYYATPLAGRFQSSGGDSGSWVVPLYWHKRYASGDLKGYYLPLGYYSERKGHKRHGFFGIYDSDSWESHWESKRDDEKGKQFTRENRNISYLLFFGRANERWDYEDADKGNERRLRTYRLNQSLFPLWSHRINDDLASGSRLEKFSLLGVLYDSRHEQESKEKEYDYLRRRFLWRLYHYEKLNGDMSTDIFPAITIDSYKNGYREFSVFWRLFRYEHDPETKKRKLDLLFIPLLR